MRLTYKTNDSLNYIGKVISEEGAKQLNTKINATVTKAYAKTMFATIKQVGTGFTTASKGANKLKEGSTTLSDGLNTYTAGVKKINDGVIELQTGVVPLSQGVIKLATGATALQSGVSEYTAGVAKVNTGTQKLNNSTGTLASGVSKLATGSNTLTSGLGTYTNGVGTLSSGLSKLSSNSSTLNSGMQTLASSTSQLPTAAAGFYVMNNVLAQDVSQINSALQANKDSVNSMSNSMAAVNTEINSTKFQTQLATLKSLAGQTGNIKTMLAELQTTLSTVATAKTDFSTSLTASLKQVATNSSTVSALAKSMQSEDNMTNADKAKLAQIIALSGSATDSSANTNATSNIAEISNIQTAATTLSEKTDLSSLSSKLESMNELVSEMDSLGTAVTNLENLMDTSNKLTDNDAQTMVKSILTLTNKVSELKSLSDTAASSANEFNSKINASSPDIDATTLASAEAIQNKVATIASTSTLSSEISKLVSGVATYTAGTNQASSGASQLSSNNSSLTSGASQLSTGLGTLNSSVPALVSGVSQLASGTSELNSNSTTLNSGTAQLASGLSQLNSKVPTLSSGVNQLASGTSQLNANSSKLTQGSSKLADGNKALAKALGKGAKKVNAVKTSNKTSNMFATPSKLVHKNYSTVPNYGYALAPYMLSVALYVGALVFNLVYPIRRLSTPDGTGTEWFLSKVAIGAVVATGTAVIETLLMMAVGLTPDHPFQMVLNAIVFSFTAMYLIMFLSVAGGNPGRFAAMILLVIQLGGSGGSFPINITNGMDGFFQAINPFLPMTYSVLGFRESLTSGLGSGQVAFSIGIMLIFIVVSLLLLWVTMVTKRKNGSVSYAEPATEEKE
ncbi:MAG: YhgE/Pip domain-containing protein [Liquorilactobacillus sp.]